MTTIEEPVRSQSPELGAMTLPKLKTVATQLGVDGAAKMKKDAPVSYTHLTLPTIYSV